MRNRIHGKQLGRDSEHRTAMLRNLAAGLFEHGQIETTMPKAKAAQPFIEKIITIAKKGGLQARRQIEARMNDRMIHAWVADGNVPDSRKDNVYFDLPSASDIEFNRYGELRKAPRLVQHVMTAIADRYRDRDGGYTRIIRTGRHRLGDGGDIVVLQLVGEEEGPQIGGGTSTRRKQADRRTAYAASLRKGEPVAEVEDEAIVENTEAPAEDEASVEEAAATDAPETEDIAEAAADSDEAAVEADDEDDKKSDG
ncbi:MAG: 50S ribosomal protein L17 [Phycisphaerales bacterium]|jgi:large subunit ribosomal protein L17|nr:50S ribosomal protein L17 [Phycisphaerales bacterium]MDP6311842.1 50S ribosomal protein L17 [Phycisphaerales bacterium]MDP7086354.1 50S ribosomal protein L17 [Phycisphaerales bacterium]MDP7189360.1 50S ribosomal protein L17 [Phycisphaerales bacterium]MDP7519964.1 50S ribosomal protein L17 [Phycisphaerales bacterium]|tara:strand:- start:2253 stop:3014 length:762 start_codon:yes stop_codon:yes gene_type:complete